jgi:hypothetical protein
MLRIDKFFESPITASGSSRQASERRYDAVQAVRGTRYLIGLAESPQDLLLTLR